MSSIYSDIHSVMVWKILNVLTFFSFVFFFFMCLHLSSKFSFTLVWVKCTFLKEI